MAAAPAATGSTSTRVSVPFFNPSRPRFSNNGRRGGAGFNSPISVLMVQSMATKSSGSSGTRSTTSGKAASVFPVGEPGSSTISRSGAPPIKLLTRVEQLRLLTKAEKAGLLSAAEKLGLSLSTIEQLGLLSKAEELGILSAATNPGTPSTLLSLSLALLVLGPVFVYFMPEDYPWEVAVQAVVAILCVIGGSAAFAASNLVADLQKSN
ncbi:hypothetical protein AKJ16_DCAP18130 [Drosera capensis]